MAKRGDRKPRGREVPLGNSPGYQPRKSVGGTGPGTGCGSTTSTPSLTSEAWSEEITWNEIAPPQHVPLAPSLVETA